MAINFDRALEIRWILAVKLSNAWMAKIAHRNGLLETGASTMGPAFRTYAIRPQITTAWMSARARILLLEFVPFINWTSASSFWMRSAAHYHLKIASASRIVPQVTFFFLTIFFTFIMLLFVTTRSLRFWRSQTLAPVALLPDYLACIGALLIFAQTILTWLQWPLQTTGSNPQLAVEVSKLSISTWNAYTEAF